MLETVAVESLVNALAHAAVRDTGGAPRRSNRLFDRDRAHRRVPAIAATALLLCPVGVGQAWAAEAPAAVDAARMNNADRDAANWLSYGRTYSEQRFSPLTKITADNAKQLGLAWFADLDTNRGQEATPLVIDGVMYVSTAWSMVKAYDAATGKLLWSYDPQVPRELGVKGCCDVVSRGVAAWNGKIYVGTFDGRLVALDARTGKPVWSVVTGDQSNLTITQAPRVIKGRVVIGMSGGEYGIRGYISAYDAETGKLAWRFYTVPGDPSKPFENKAMAMAAKTWSGEWWKHGGGGTVWDAISYDPKLNLIYFGVGQRSRMGAQLSQRGQRRQPFPLLHRGAERRHRRVRVALSGQSGRGMGLRRRRAAHARRPDHRRQAPPGHHAGEQERLLLRPRPQDRQIHIGQALRAAELGERSRPEDRPADRACGHPLQRDR